MTTLTEHHISAALNAGRHVEQFLLPRTDDGETIIRWLDLALVNATYLLKLYEVFDDGSPEFLDVYAFDRVSPDAEPPSHSFASLDEVLTFAVNRYDAVRDGFVSQGLIQDEYAAYMRSKC